MPFYLIFLKTSQARRLPGGEREREDLQPGDCLVVYAARTVEARDATGTFFGEDR